MRLHIAAVLAFTVVCASRGACQGSKSSDSTSSAKPAGSAKPDESHITDEAITSAQLPTAYDLVERLRRKWLRPDAVTGGDVTVYADEQNLGDATKLRDIPSVEVSELQYLANRDAVRHWGAAVKGAVIVVVRKR